MTKYALAKLGKTAAVIYENAQAGIDGRDDFKKIWAGGGKIVADEAVEFGQTNYRPTMLKVALEARFRLCGHYPEPRGLRRAGRQDPGVPDRRRHDLHPLFLRLSVDRRLVSHRHQIRHRA